MMKNVMRGASLFVIPITAWFEAGVFVYWISANGFAVTQVLKITYKKIKNK